MGGSRLRLVCAKTEDKINKATANGQGALVILLQYQYCTGVCPQRCPSCGIQCPLEWPSWIVRSIERAKTRALSRTSSFRRMLRF